MEKQRNSKEKNKRIRDRDKSRNINLKRRKKRKVIEKSLENWIQTKLNNKEMKKLVTEEINRRV